MIISRPKPQTSKKMYFYVSTLLVVRASIVAELPFEMKL